MHAMRKGIKRRRKQRRENILMRLLTPLFAVVLLQSILYVTLLWKGSVIAHVDQNAYDILTERAALRTQYIRDEMLYKWGNLVNDEKIVVESIEATLRAKGKAPGDIAHDAALNAAIVEELVPQLIYTMRKNAVTGAFVVLDGPALEGAAQGGRAGYYLRDLDPRNYSVESTDIMVKRGLPSITKALGLAFDPLWRPAFTFQGEGAADSRYFYAVYDAARGGQVRDAESGYWAPAHRLDAEDVPAISYSIPIILSDGSLVGVMGIDITEIYMTSLLQYNEIQPDQRGAYFLATTEDGTEYRRVSAAGPLVVGEMGNPNTMRMGEQITGEQMDGKTRMVAAPSMSDPVLGCVQPLILYGEGAPFSGEAWALIALVERHVLLQVSSQIMQTAVLITAITLAVGLLGVYMASLAVTGPITSLVRDLKESDPNKPVALKKLRIKEIDELTYSIEALSASVAESASKISTILSMTKMSIGVFEYDEQGDAVFCSGNLFAVLGWPSETTEGTSFIRREEFERRMKHLNAKLADDQESIFTIVDEHGMSRWVQMTIKKRDHKVLGAVTDVTRDMLEKRQIEHERDYDLLTNFYNLRAFHQQLSDLFASHKDLGVGAFIMWDIDNLKYINDTYGHEWGDRYIVALADALGYFDTACPSISARRSGDEFYTFIYGFEDIDQARAVINDAWKHLNEQPFILPGGIDYHIRVSAGIAWLGRDSDSWQELLRYADYAMYTVKHTVKGSINEFNKTAYLGDETVLYGMEALNKLIDYSLVKYAFQPILSVKSGEVYGYEMLMRPQVNEFKTPMDVLRIAQSQAKLYYIERITWFSAMKEFVERIKRGEIEEDKRVFINSIGNQMMTDEDIRAFNETYAPYLDSIVLEMIESERGVSEYLQRKIDLVRGWRGLIAIDDYGTGYNSEASLVFLSPNLVKLDMSLVHDIDKDIDRQDMLRSIIDYVKTRGIGVLAEGVETEAEMRMLVAYGVNYLQGYYIAKPSFDISPINPDVLAAVRDAYEARGQQPAEEQPADRPEA